MARTSRGESAEEKKRQRNEKAAQADYVVGYCKTADHTKFKPGNKAARRKPKPPADYDWSAYQVGYPDKRPPSFTITDIADLGADMLEEMVTFPINGELHMVPFSYAVVQYCKRDILKGSRRDRTESMRFLRSFGVIDRLQQRQGRRAMEFERNNNEWWARRTLGLTMMTARAKELGNLNDNEALDDIIGKPLFEGEEERILANLEEAERMAASSQPEVSDIQAEIDRIVDEIERSALSDDITIEDEETFDAGATDQSSPAAFGDVVLGDPNNPLDLAHGHLGPPETAASENSQDEGPPSLDDGTARVTRRSDGAAEENVGLDNLSEAEEPPPPERDPPSGAKLEEGDEICWIKKGPGDQEIRNKGGWKHGEKSKK